MPSERVNTSDPTTLAMAKLTQYAYELWHHRELLAAWTEREIRVRYKQSVIGGLWAILQPLTLMIVFTVVFSLFARVPTDGVPYPVFSYVALLPWTFFASAITFAVPSLVNNMNLVTKVYFPREVLPLAAIGAALVDFGVAALMFAAMLVAYGIAPAATLLWLPLIMLVQIALTLGVVLFLSAVNVFFRDIRFVIPLATQVWMYATPVIYPLTIVPEAMRPWYMLNPMAAVIDSYRRVILLGTSPAWPDLLQSAAISLIVLVAGYGYFKRSEGEFADVI